MIIFKWDFAYLSFFYWFLLFSNMPYMLFHISICTPQLRSATAWAHHFCTLQLSYFQNSPEGNFSLSFCSAGRRFRGHSRRTSQNFCCIASGPLFCNLEFNSWPTDSKTYLARVAKVHIMIFSSCQHWNIWILVLGQNLNLSVCRLLYFPMKNC